ncbi:uncharacterized protein [Primulina eburnea]|uniref:uncharacterized protein n=1 Tax=Primulina eburnea TaxID=1245227 RepID=UPI003C6BFFA7
MALMSELSQWCSIRTPVNELHFSANLLFRSQEACDKANDLLRQRQTDLDSVDSKLQRYKRKKESGKKQKKYAKGVKDFEARRRAAEVEVDRALQVAQRMGRKLERARRRRGRRQALIEARIRDFLPTGYVKVMEVADITSIEMMRDQRKQLYFTMGRSVTDSQRVSIIKAAKKIELHDLSSNTLGFLDGANFRILSVEESEKMGYRRLV